MRWSRTRWKGVAKKLVSAAPRPSRSCHAHRFSTLCLGPVASSSVWGGGEGAGVPSGPGSPGTSGPRAA